MGNSPSEPEQSSPVSPKIRRSEIVSAFNDAARRHSMKARRHSFKGKPAERRGSAVQSESFLNVIGVNLSASEEHLIETATRSHTEVLTAWQKKLLGRLWRHTSRQKLGQNVMRRLCDGNKASAEIFGLPHPLPENYQCFPIFNQRAAYFADAIALAMENLEELEAVAGPELFKIGKLHAEIRNSPVPFRASMWDAMADAMTDSAMDWVQLGAAGGVGAHHRETVKACVALISWLVDRMRFGYEVELKRQRRASQSHNFTTSSPRGSRTPSPRPGASTYEPEEPEDQWTQDD